jgi:hypothetical protein
MNARFIVLLFFSLSLVFSSLIYGDIPEVQRKALIALYNSTNGAGWTDGTGWNDNPGTEPTWYGVTCDQANTKVLGIDLKNNNLVGTIPAELGDLSNLTSLDLSSNRLAGIIPSQLGNLADLKVLDLHSNQLTGISPGLENLANLTHLYLDRNRITGSIPAGFGELTGLEVLSLGANRFSGGIPPGLGSLPGLVKLYVYGSRLSGGIPLQIGDLANLQYIELHGNRLTGAIPLNMINPGNLADDDSDLRWNALYTGDESLRDFLNLKQDGGDWESTQTTAPGDVTAAPIAPSTVRVSWAPISYTGDGGNYRVFYSTAPGGPYTLFRTTDDKTASRVDVTGLHRGTTYYFVVQSFTHAHGNNPNRIESEYSTEVSAVPSGEITDDPEISGRIVTGRGTGVYGVTITFPNKGGTVDTNFDGRYSHRVYPLWSGKVTPSKPGYRFNPNRRPYEDVIDDLKGVDFTAVPTWPEISGSITIPTKDGSSGVPNVKLTFADKDGDGETFTYTDANGNYSHTVEEGWSGEVIPAKSKFVFSPTKLGYTGVKNHQPNQNYLASRADLLISGKITASDSTPVPGVVLTFSDNGGTTLTDDNGSYSQPVPYGWSGKVTPGKKGWKFDPLEKPYSNLSSDTRLDFTGIQTVVLTLKASLQVESTVLIQKQYGKIDLTVMLTGDTHVSTYTLLRKKVKEDTRFLPIVKKIPADEIQSGETYTYEDIDIDKDWTYIYKVEARGENGEIVGESNEASIQCR